MTRILVTNDGPHSPEQWAVVSAETIFDIDQAVVGDRLLSAKKLQMAIAEALMEHFDANQKTERKNLKASRSHILSDHNQDAEVEHVVEDVQIAAQGSPWEAHFKTQPVIDAITHVVKSHMISSAHIERLWHADRNPQSDEAQAYKAKFIE